MFCVEDSGIARGQTLQVARRKYMAKNCFDVQKYDFGERSTLFRQYFIRDGFGHCWVSKSVSFCLNNREIRNQVYRYTSAFASASGKVYFEIDAKHRIRLVANHSLTIKSKEEEIYDNNSSTIVLKETFLVQGCALDHERQEKRPVQLQLRSENSHRANFVFFLAILCCFAFQKAKLFEMESLNP